MFAFCKETRDMQTDGRTDKQSTFTAAQHTCRFSGMTVALWLCDHTSLRLSLLHLPTQAYSCDLLLALLAYADGGAVCDHTRLNIPLLHLPKQAHCCDLPLAVLACAGSGLVYDHSGLHVSLLHLPKQLTAVIQCLPTGMCSWWQCT